MGKRYIDADALLESIPQKYVGFRYAVTNAPTADVVERKRGKWIKGKKSLWSVGKCSVCGAISVEADTANYCPHCGAEMEE